mmetsp:Transcript_61102/g.177139  ORF Transcript_61102/g.177139 Transcript_61102/m.177139 type:complete len:346 (+) Transcript_61102:1969-3006(+)
MPQVADHSPAIGGVPRQVDREAVAAVGGQLSGHWGLQSVFRGLVGEAIPDVGGHKPGRVGLHASHAGLVHAVAIRVNVRVQLRNGATFVLLHAQLPQAYGAEEHRPLLGPDEARVPSNRELVRRVGRQKRGDAGGRILVLGKSAVDELSVHEVPERIETVHLVDLTPSCAVARSPVQLLLRSRGEDISGLEDVDISREKNHQHDVEHGLPKHDLEIPVFDGVRVVNPIDGDVREILPEHRVAHEPALVVGLFEYLLQLREGALFRRACLLVEALDDQVAVQDDLPLLFLWFLHVREDLLVAGGVHAERSHAVAGARNPPGALAGAPALARRPGGLSASTAKRAPR